MIKAKARTTSGRQVLMFGLSGENVTRLVAGEPILFRLEELAVDGFDVVIAYGKTEDDVKQDLMELAVKLS